MANRRCLGVSFARGQVRLRECFIDWAIARVKTEAFRWPPAAWNACAHRLMKPTGTSLESVIAIAAGLAGIYLAGIACEVPLEWVLGLYGLAVVATVWMAIRILKDPFTVDKTFDDRFYQDREDLRPSGKH